MDQIVFRIISFDEDVYFYNLYNQPNCSNVLKCYDVDIYDHLEIGIIKYNNLGNVSISDHLNSRTSDFVDEIIHDKYLDQTCSYFIPVDIPVRKSQDCITDYIGIKLLNLCLSNKLTIANPRLHDDHNVGKVTSFSRNGQSVMDYQLLHF